MADGITIFDSLGATVTVLTDDTGVPGHAQVVKLALSANGSSVLIGADAANGLDVDVTRVTGTVAVNPTGETAGIGTGATADVEATANGSVIALLKRLRTILGVGATFMLKAEDAVHVSGDSGIMALAVRSDAGGTLSSATGDYTPLQTDAAGQLRVTGGGGGTEYTEDVASAADPTGHALLARRRDTLTATEVSADGDIIALNATAEGQLHTFAELGETAGVGIGAIADAEATGTSNGTVIGILKRLRTLLGVGAASVLKAEDAAHVSGDAGVMSLAVRSDAGGTLVSASGDYAPLQVDAAGALRVAGGGGGTQYNEDDASAANPVGNQVLLRRRDTLSASEVTADGDVIAANATAKGQAHVYAEVGSSPAAARTTDAVAAALQTDALMNGLTALTPKYAKIVASAAGLTSVVAFVALKKIRVLGYVLVANGTVNVKFQSTTGPTDLTGLEYLAANGGVSSGFNPLGWFETITGESLSINLSGAVAVGGHVCYVEV